MGSQFEQVGKQTKIGSTHTKMVWHMCMDSYHLLMLFGTENVQATTPRSRDDITPFLQYGRYHTNVHKN